MCTYMPFISILAELWSILKSSLTIQKIWSWFPPFWHRPKRTQPICQRLWHLPICQFCLGRVDSRLGGKGPFRGAGVETNEFSFFQEELPDFALIGIGFVSARATLPQDLATWGDFIHQEERPKGGCVWQKPQARMAHTWGQWGSPLLPLFVPHWGPVLMSQQKF